MNVQNIHLENVVLTAEQGGMIMDADQISMKNVDIRVNKGPILYLNNLQNTRFRNVTIGFKNEVEPGLGLRIEGPFTEAVNLSGIKFSNTNQKLSISSNVEKTEIIQSN